MFTTLRYLLVYITIIVLVYNMSLYAESVVNDIDYGSLNVGQTKYVSIPIVNDENNPWEIERVSACCGNPNPTISMMTIPVGKSAELIQEVKKTNPGPFTIIDKVYLKEPKGKVLSFSIRGEAKQPVTVSVGWAESSLKSASYQDESIRLDQVNRNGKILTLCCLSSEQSRFNLKDSLLSVESRYFSLDTSSLANGKLEDDASHQSRDNHVITLNLRLVPKSLFPVGELSDTIVAKFRNGSECYVPITFRSVGNVYAEYSSIGVGQISMTGKISKIFKIYFNKGVKPWRQAKWNVEGKLSEAINVLATEVKDTENCLNLKIEIEGSHLSSSDKGFVHSHITFYEDTPDEDNAVKLLVYGYR